MGTKIELEMLTEKERKLIDLWREMKFGTLEKITIQEGEPVMIEKVISKTKL